MILRQLNPITLHGVTVLQSSSVKRKPGEPLEDLAGRYPLACMACGARLGTRFTSEEWLVCDLHALSTATQEATS